MLEMLLSIPGPRFLIIFPLLTVAAIMVGRVLINGSRSTLRLPSPAEFDPVTIACLRGGWKNLVDLNLRPMPDDDPFAREPWIPANDMVILVSFADPEGKPFVELLVRTPAQMAAGTATRVHVPITGLPGGVPPEAGTHIRLHMLAG